MLSSKEREILEKRADQVRRKLEYMEKNNDFQNKMIKKGINGRACLEKCLHDLEEMLR